MTALSDILKRLRGGDAAAASELFAQVYEELHRFEDRLQQIPGLLGDTAKK